MAVWQFDLHVLPASEVRRRTDECKSSEALLGFLNEGMPWGASNASALVRVADSLLTERTSWSDHLRIWGIEDGHRLDISFEDDVVGSVFVRIDMRDAPDFVERLAAIGLEEDWVFLTDNGKLIEPSVADLAQAMIESPAAKFVEDPAAFLSVIAASKL